MWPFVSLSFGGLKTRTELFSKNNFFFVLKIKYSGTIYYGHFIKKKQINSPAC